MRPPASTPEITLDMVSFHAVTRYCQRVLGVTVPGMENDVGLSGSGVALAHCALAGTSVNAVRKAILTPAVRLGLQLGATAARGAGYELRLGTNPPSVITLCPPDQLSALRVLSITETRRSNHRRGRRCQQVSRTFGEAS